MAEDRQAENTGAPDLAARLTKEVMQTVDTV